MLPWELGVGVLPRARACLGHAGGVGDRDLAVAKRVGGSAECERLRLDRPIRDHETEVKRRCAADLHGGREVVRHADTVVYDYVACDIDFALRHHHGPPCPGRWAAHSIEGVPDPRDHRAHELLPRAEHEYPEGDDTHRVGRRHDVHL